MKPLQSPGTSIDNCHPVPTDLTVWDWLFDSSYSPLRNNKTSDLRGYTNAITKERVSYAQVKEYTTYLSTALVKKYGLKENQTVALFSPNTIWYPVAMLGILRAGWFPTTVFWSGYEGMLMDNYCRSRGFRRFSGLQHRGDDIRAQDGGRKIPHDATVFDEGRSRGGQERGDS